MGNNSIQELENKIEKLETQKKIVEKELNKKKETLIEFSICSDYKKQGNGWFILTLILIGIEIYLLCTGGKFSYADLIYIGIPLVIGGYRKIQGLVSYKDAKSKIAGIDEIELKEKVDEIQSLVNDLERELNETKTQFNKLTKYNGKNWDMTIFVANSDNLKQLEKDIENLFVAVEYMSEKEIIDTWLCANRMLKFTALLQKDKAQENKLDAWFGELGKSDSWKLKTIQYVVASMDLTLLSALGSDPVSFEDLVKNNKKSYRLPETDEEKEFYQLAMDASITINDTLEYALKK